mmetsp:Transcript_18951/g.38107  ORF Transcript_18951/g.38107 Transcript_18951/m.38107 type:complete len:354 (+) Transcript_18951:267-1328(+)
MSFLRILFCVCVLCFSFHCAPPALMSRSDIAEMLSKCLTGVTTRSGIPAGTPSYFVANSSGDIHRVEELLDRAPFTYPIIVKPLPAAGTKASHHMLVVLNRRGLRRVQFPCIVQEYANHDGRLYKVYVLGDTVRVFPRGSLPNLPRGERLHTTASKNRNKNRQEDHHHPGYVEFDSQRPYPKLSDFGVREVHSWQDADNNATGAPAAVSPTAHSSAKRLRVTISHRVTLQDTAAQQREQEAPVHQNKHSNAKLVTADEIRPIATALRNAFGLELFGFDILVTSNNDDDDDDDACCLACLLWAKGPLPVRSYLARNYYYRMGSRGHSRRTITTGQPQEQRQNPTPTNDEFVSAS